MIVRIEVKVIEGKRIGEEGVEHWLVCDHCGCDKPIFNYPDGVPLHGWCFVQGPGLALHFCSRKCNLENLGRPS
jgi:ribosomal protein L24E